MVVTAIPDRLPFEPVVQIADQSLDAESTARRGRLAWAGWLQNATLFFIFSNATLKSANPIDRRKRQYQSICVSGFWISNWNIGRNSELAVHVVGLCNHITCVVSTPNPFPAAGLPHVRVEAACGVAKMISWLLCARPGLESPTAQARIYTTETLGLNSDLHTVQGPKEPLPRDGSKIRWHTAMNIGIGFSVPRLNELLL
ncbi:hypothetical protein FB45DRAFT_870341 [Roridomyces roridus]|uniref:Uncharacterized protein n=1 Tax=Roridomyces roridus TaxID=1738132 RepID=A0AAD7FFZ6_9AGAR|nr:hypothetical protein FB45DRAFT_870341 [Roridomyces roridus]